MKYIIILLLILPLHAFAQLTKQDSLWLPLKGLIGTWKGTGEGPDGKGTYERTYQRVLNNKYIEVRNKTEYLPTAEKPKGYHHEDFGVISYDKARKKFVFRQFQIEGFVNEYLLESISADGKTITFVTESIENIPAGWRGRETYTFTENGFTEVFDLAEPGKDFAPYTRARFQRQK